MDTQQKISAIVQSFSSDISQLLKIVDAKLAGNLEVDRLKRVIRIARDEEPLMIINKCKDKIWDSREQILAEDEDFFISKRYDEYIKKDENQMFIEGLINLFKRSRSLLSEKESKFMWATVKHLLATVTEYKMLIEDYE
jgi:hypothetical protein